MLWNSYENTSQNRYFISLKINFAFDRSSPNPEQMIF